MKKSLKIKFLILSIILIIISSAIFLILLFTNKLAIWGICPLGKVSRQIPSGYICHEPTGKEGDKCKTAKDCNGGGCRLTDPNSEYPGICHDLQYGCWGWIDENGNYDENIMICID